MMLRAIFTIQIVFYVLYLNNQIYMLTKNENEKVKEKMKSKNYFTRYEIMRNLYFG